MEEMSLGELRLSTFSLLLEGSNDWSPRIIALTCAYRRAERSCLLTSQSASFAAGDEKKRRRPGREQGVVGVERQATPPTSRSEPCR